jgi:hypothetical protein
MGEMGEVALENGWAFFTSQRCDEVAEKSVWKKWEMGEETREKVTRLKKWVEMGPFFEH